MTSAATPLFQQRPRPTVQAERKYGSLTGYLRATGLTQAELDLLRAKLLN